MYQVIGLAKTLTIFAISCIGMFILLHHGDMSMLLEGPLKDLWRATTSSVALGSALLYAIGQSPVFVWLCKLPFISKIFPPIDGEWDVTFESNWGVMQKWLGQGDGSALFVSNGKVKITSRIFGIRMEFQSSDGYSESKTISVSVRKSQQAGTLELNYMFTNYTFVPLPTDTNYHTGAARVFVRQGQDGLSMVGAYFTDRKWTEGLNTAGRVTFMPAQ